MGKLSEMFIKRVREERERLGLSLEKIASRCGMHYQTIQRYFTENEKRRVTPGLDVVELIAEALNTPPASLLTERDQVLDREHPIEECHRRIGEKLKKAESVEDQHKKPKPAQAPLRARLADLPPQEKIDLVLWASDIVREWLSSLSPQEQGSYFEELRSNSPHRKG